MVNATFEFFLPYKEICWLKLQLCNPSTLHMYSKASEKGPLDYNYSLFIKGIILHYMQYH